MRDKHPNTQGLSESGGFEIVEVAGSDGDARLALRGEFDVASCDQLTARLDELAARGATVHLDLSELAFIDSSGLAVLLHHARAARENGWRLDIRRDGLQNQVERLVKLTGADQLLWPPE